MEKMKDDYSKYIARIKKRLDENPEYVNKIKEHIISIERMLDANISVSLLYYNEFEEFNNNIENEEEYFGELANPPINNPLELKEFIKFLDDVDENLTVSIDPINLKKGINDITNVIAIPYEGRILLVPTIKNNEDE